MKAGERYVIEIDKVYVPMKIGEDFKLARTKGFNSLVFDENGLSKLEKLEDVIREECDRARQEGFEAGHESGTLDILKKIDTAIERAESVHNGCGGCEYVDEDFNQGGHCINCKHAYINMYSPKEVEKTIGIQPYDICQYKGSSSEHFCVTRIYREGTGFFFDAIYSDGSVLDDGNAKLIEKIRHVDSLDEWLRD